jgi:predicted nucleotidyltransferase
MMEKLMRHPDIELDKIVASIGANYQPEKIILFGSLAEGTASGESDIDLLVIKETDKNPWDRSAEVDRYVDHQVPVDILVYTPAEIAGRLSVNDLFIKDICTRGKVIYEKGV